MKLPSVIFIFAFLVLSAFAAAPRHSFIVTYPDNTPEYKITETKEAIKKAGGVITHEYHYIKGFAAKAAKPVLDKVRPLLNHAHAVLEGDDSIYAADESM